MEPLHLQKEDSSNENTCRQPAHPADRGRSALRGPAFLLADLTHQLRRDVHICILSQPLALYPPGATHLSGSDPVT